jgi:hypothetical protein
MGTRKKDSSNITSMLKYLCIIIFLFSIQPSLFAQGDLLIYPKRLVFEGRKSIQKLTLANTGKDTAVYNISFVEYKMNENGQLKIISKAEEGLQFASSNVRFYPRKVTLAPNESQIVKVQLRGSQSLKDGEYRSHLYFRAEEKKAPLGEISKSKDSIIAVKLKPIFGISIPCIVRKGENTTNVSISDMQLIEIENNSYGMQFHLNRTGNMSAYGDVTINYTSPANEVYEVAKTKGIGIYTPGNLRIVKIKLKTQENINFNGGTFNITFTKNESKKILAEATLTL